MSFQLWSRVRSDSLDMDTSLAVVTPARESTDLPGLLILLHGLTGNHMQWPSHTDLDTLANRHNLVIAMPDGERSFWIDQRHGLNWGQWVGQELPRLLQSQLWLSDTTIIGGLSMGGYGAIVAALDYPETFDAAFSLSGTLDITEPAFIGRHPDFYQIGFGDPQTPRPSCDLVARLGEHPTRVPPLFTCCGTDDRLFEQNLRFVDAAEAAGLPVQWHQGPGAHNFGFWNRWLPLALEAVHPIGDRG